METSRGDLNRQGSRRGRKPPANIGRKSLPRSTSPNDPQPKVFYLVVCGATRPEDHWIFSDFMGWCRMLIEKQVKGDFVSCFPLQLAFKELKNFYNLETIRFGKVRQPDTTSETWMYEYTRDQFENLPLWYIEKSKEDIKDYIVRWICDAALRANSGDTVNIVFEAHGDKETKGVVLAGVEVNCISGACYSGAFVDAISASGQGHRYAASAMSATEVAQGTTRSSSGRIRNSRYSQAFVQSFARITLPQDPTPSHTTMTIDEHHAFMTRQILRNLTPGSLPDPHQHTTMAPITGTDLITKVVLNNMIDVIYDPAVTHRRRRLEWPRMNEPYFERIASFPSNTVPANTKAFVDGVIADELSKCGGVQEQLPVDNGCLTQLVYVPDAGFQAPNQGQILHALYYRARQQSAIWDVYCALVDKGFINVEGLLTPTWVNGRTTPAVQRVGWLLSCFELTSKEPFHQEAPYKLWSTTFADPTSWLATMIIRGCNDVEQLFDTILASGFLGSLDEEAFQHYCSNCNPKHFDVNPKECEGMEKKKTGPFGFWLPHGLQGETPEKAYSTIYTNHLMRFNRIEEAFKRYFAVSDEEILLEFNQTLYYDKNPEKLPRNTSGIGL